MLCRRVLRSRMWLLSFLSLAVFGVGGVSSVLANLEEAENVSEEALETDMEIVAGTNPTDRFAASELQNYIVQATNRRVPIIDAPSTRASGLVFLLGTIESNPLIASLAAEGKIRLGGEPEGFTGCFLTGQAIEGYERDLLVIAGNGDVSLGGGSAKRLVGDWRSMRFEDKEQHLPARVNSSVLYGVYAFLEETLSFCSLPENALAPADTHEWIDRVTPDEFRRRIGLLADKPIVQEPTFRIRGSWFIDSYQNWRTILPWMSKNRMNQFTVYSLAFNELNGKLPKGASRPPFTWDELRALVDEAHKRGIEVHAQLFSRPYAGVNWYPGGFEQLLRELTGEEIPAFLDGNPHCKAGPTKGRSSFEGGGPAVAFECTAHVETRQYFAWLVNRFIDALEDQGVYVDNVNLGEFDSGDGCLCPKCEGKRDLAEIRLATAVVDSLDRRGVSWRPVVWCVRGNPQELASFFGHDDPYLGSSLGLVAADRILGWIRPYGNMGEAFYRNAYMRSFKKALPNSLLIIDNQVMAWSDEMAPYRIIPKAEYLWNSQRWIAKDLGGAVGMMPDIRVERSEVTVTVYARAMWDPFERELQDELTRVAAAFYGRNVGGEMAAAVQLLEKATAGRLYGYMGASGKYSFFWFKNPPGNGRYRYHDYVALKNKPGSKAFYNDFAEAQRASAEAAELAAGAAKEALNDSYREKIEAARLTARYYAYEARALETLSAIYDHVYNAKVAVKKDDWRTAREWLDKATAFAEQSRDLIEQLRSIIQDEEPMKYPPKFKRELYQIDFFEKEILGNEGYLARKATLLEQESSDFLKVDLPDSLAGQTIEERIGSRFVVPGKP
jgi:hypothetical protein